MNFTKYSLIYLLSAMWMITLSQAQWPTNPQDILEICTLPEFQDHPKCHQFPNGDILIMWIDMAIYEDYKLKYQIIDQYGNIKLPINGIQLIESDYNTRLHRFIQADNGDLIVIFMDNRNGIDMDDIFAQRFNSSGNKLWGADGTPVSILLNEELSIMEAVTDSAGGAFVVISRYEINDGDLYMQHLSAEGERLWGETGAIFRDTTSWGGASQAVPDLEGGVIVVFEDGRDQLYDFTLYIQHLDADGNSLWRWNGVPFRDLGGDQWHSYVCEAISDGEGGGIWYMNTTAWSTLKELAFERIGYDGEIVWEEQDISPYCSLEPEQMIYHPIDNQYWAVSTENREGYPNPSHPYLYRFDVDGNFSFTGIRIGNLNYTQREPRMCVYLNGVILFFIDDRNSANDVFTIYVQEIDNTGILNWNPPDGILSVVSYGIVGLGGLYPISNGLDGSILTFYDRRSGDDDIYATSILHDGTLGGPPAIEVEVEIQEDNIVLSWLSVYGADCYNVYKSDEPYNFPVAPDTTVSDTVFIDLDAAGEQKLFYWISYTY